jgi:hypothetical protein
MFTTPLSSDPEVKVQFDPGTETAQVFLVYPETTTGSNPETEAETETEAESQEPAGDDTGAGPEPPPRRRDASRRNALKDGLTSKVVFTADLAAEVERCTALLTEVYQPTNDYEKKLIGDMGRSSAQLEEIAKQKIMDHTRIMDRAREHWDDDRRTYVADLGTKLPRQPSRVTEALGNTKQGLEWLLNRWNTLDSILRHAGEWDEAQRQVAFDLLGIDHALRPGNPMVPAGTDTVGLAALVADQIDALNTLLEASLEKDAQDQSFAMMGILLEEDAATKRLRRNERDARRDYRYARAELDRVRAEAARASGSGIGGAAAPAAPSPAAQSGYRSQAQSRPQAPITPRPVVSRAAAAFMDEEMSLLPRAKVITPRTAAPAAATATATATAAPAPSSAATKPLPRRVRKERAKKARQAARQQARQAARQQAG